VVPRELVGRRGSSGRIGGALECADDSIDAVVDERLGDGLARDGSRVHIGPTRRSMINS
jgi:hypothetical protein